LPDELTVKRKSSRAIRIAGVLVGFLAIGVGILTWIEDASTLRDHINSASILLLGMWFCYFGFTGQKKVHGGLE
jgi:hypothetical protein